MSMITIALASTLACQTPSNGNVVGLWESTAISRGGIGHNFEFRDDGSYTTAAVVLVDLNYDIKDGKIYIAKNKGEPVSYEQGARMELNEDGFILVGENGEREVRNRFVPSNENSIVGFYKYRHYTGGTAYEQYTKDGLMKLRLPMTSVNGCYTVEKDTLTLVQAEMDPKKVKYSLSQGQLQLDDSDKSYSYVFVKEGAWYESEEIDYQKPRE